MQKNEIDWPRPLSKSTMMALPQIGLPGLVESLVSPQAALFVSLSALSSRSIFVPSRSSAKGHYVFLLAMFHGDSYQYSHNFEIVLKSFVPHPSVCLSPVWHLTAYIFNDLLFAKRNKSFADLQNIACQF